MLFANKTPSSIPELTPSPAIGWIEWAASPTKAKRCLVYTSAWSVFNGKANLLFANPDIFGIVLYYLLCAFCLFDEEMRILICYTNY